MARRPSAKTTRLDDLPPDEVGPSPDELVDLGGESTDAFVERTGSTPPPRLAAGDAVPLFRPDLEIGKGREAGLVEVAEPGTGRRFTLYEFELSIARMLDGRRHASDVIENGARLGIPVDLDGLDKFVRQLWRYGFLAEPGTELVAADGEESGWGEREKWDEATRTLFQTGLRLARQGRPHDAQSYFQAVLDADPANPEATAMLAAVERGESLVATPIGRRSAGRATGARRRWRLATLGISLFAAAAAGFFAAKRLRPQTPPVIAVPPPPAPPPWRIAAVESRGHPAVAELAAEVAGTVAWRKRTGDRVTSGERIGLLRRRSGARRDLPIAAPSTGLLTLTAADRARVAAGAALASIADDAVWIIEGFVDGDPPPSGTACELLGDKSAQRLPCRIEGAHSRDGGSVVQVVAQAREAAWIGAARPLRLRVAPAGSPPVGGGK